MSDKFNQLIELLIAEDEEKAQELFHEIVVERSRSIYESLIDEETVDEAEEEVAEEEAVEEEAVEESDFDEELGGDAADDMIDDIEADEQGLAVEDDDSDEDIEDRVVDLEDALDELKAEFEKIMGGDEEEGPEMDMDMDDEMDMEMGDEEADEEEEEMESVEETEEVVREYSEKVNAKNVEEGDGASGPVAGKNDMGGKAVDPTGEEKGGAAPKAAVQTDAANPKGATMSKA
jgi:hypothetical protein